MGAVDPPVAVDSHVAVETAMRFRWTPFDSAGGTIALGLALTAMIIAVMRLLH